MREALIGLLLLAALPFRAGNRPLPLALLECLGLILLASQQRAAFRFLRAYPVMVLSAAALLIVYPLIQLVPIPDGWWLALPGRAPYAESFALAGMAAATPASGWHALTLDPALTEQGLLSVIPGLACALVVPAMDTRRILRLLAWMAVLATAEAALGVLEAAHVVETLGGWVEGQESVRTAAGTFANQDHFASFLAMSALMSVGLALAFRRLATLERGRPPVRRSRPSDHAAHKASSDTQNFWAGLCLLAALLQCLTLPFTQSRAGVLSLAVGTLPLLAYALLRAARSRRQQSWIAAATLTSLVLILFAAPSGLRERFSGAGVHPEVVQRTGLTLSSLRAAAAFFPFGTGLSTFPAVYPRFQPAEVTEFANAAHDDYAQLVLECGAAGCIALVLGLVAYARRMWTLARDAAPRSFTRLQFAAGVAMLAALIHSAVDFPLRIPANAIWFSVLAGVLWHPGNSEESPSAQVTKA